MGYERNYVKEQEILNFIKTYISENGFSPTFREICKAVNLKSTDSIYRYCQRLKNEKKIHYIEGQTRTITLKEGA